MGAETITRVYRVLVNGENFLLSKDGNLQKMGFYTTRFVEARTPEEAEELAIGLIKGDAWLSGSTMNERGDSPMLYVEEIEEVRDLEPASGYSFYDQES